ncbi:MAG TPA: CoA transferase, partial [Acidobacteriota bacterium]|nr:CoA transferase [Acidobacteriota bacterium]
PAGEILSLQDALEQPQIRHRGSLATVTDPELGALRLFTLTAKLEKTPGALRTPPPRLSEHTEEILGELGYDREELEKLRQEGVV